MFGRNDAKERSWLIYLFAITVVVGCYYLIKWIIAAVSISPRLGLPDDMLQPGSWIYAVEHHLIQGLLAVVAILVASRGRFDEWGFTLRNRRESLTILKKFSYYYLGYFVGISFVIQFIAYPGPPFDHSFTLVQIIGFLLYGFLLTGLVEEILFRGFIHTFLSRYIPEVWHWRTIEMPVAGAITAIIFTVAHIGFTLYPFEIWHFHPLQLLQAFILGLFYSWAYHRTQSLLAPILAHNLSNGSLWTMDYILYWLKSGAIPLF